MFSKLKQFRDLRTQAKTIQSALAEETVDGSAGFGKVKIKMDGNQEVKNVMIDAELLTPDKKEKLEGLVKDAFNDTVKQVHRVMAEKMKKMGGLNIPGLTKSQ
ncbi:MAG: DNA-binding protein, YbaB/EbfC family [Candidatus Magasanikbacteria bacterium]|nr:DNA-binding protein, YbaB/EbfC family [Candidatus Magasanikbacteria bacterium]